MTIFSGGACDTPMYLIGYTGALSTPIRLIDCRGALNTPMRLTSRRGALHAPFRKRMKGLKAKRVVNPGFPAPPETLD